MIAVTLVVYLDEPDDTSEDQIKNTIYELIHNDYLKKSEYYQLVSHEVINAKAN